MSYRSRPNTSIPLLSAESIGSGFKPWSTWTRGELAQPRRVHICKSLYLVWQDQPKFYRTYTDGHYRFPECMVRRIQEGPQTITRHVINHLDRMRTALSSCSTETIGICISCVSSQTGRMKNDLLPAMSKLCNAVAQQPGNRIHLVTDGTPGCPNLTRWIDERMEPFRQQRLCKRHMGVG